MKCAFLIAFLVAVVAGLFAGGVESRGFVTAKTSSAAALYARNCALCHGRDGRAKTFKAKRNHARNLNDSQWQDRVSDERIFNSIMNGKGKMPAYGKKFSEQEIDGLVNYVRGLKK